MTALQIILLIIGVIFFIGSFFVTEKLSSSDIEQLRKIGEKEIRIMIEKELTAGQAGLESKINDQVNIAADEFERSTDKETNEKIMSISEYSNTVLNTMNEESNKALKAMNETHDQIMFLYNMLNEKQEKATQLTQEMQTAESNLLEIKDHIQSLGERYEVTLKQMDEINDQEMQKQKAKEEMQGLKNAFMAKIIEDQDPEDASKTTDDKSQILQMYKEGYSEVEIAKRIGKGLGEIKLILGLFEEEYHQ